LRAIEVGESATSHTEQHHNILGIVCGLKGDHTSAAAHFEVATQRFRRIGAAAEWYGRLNLAWTDLHLARITRARDAFYAVLQHGEGRDEMAVWNARIGLAAACGLGGDWQRARELLRQDPPEGLDLQYAYAQLAHHAREGAGDIADQAHERSVAARTASRGFDILARGAYHRVLQKALAAPSGDGATTHEMHRVLRRICQHMLLAQAPAESFEAAVRATLAGRAEDLPGWVAEALAADRLQLPPSAGGARDG
jgi:hypothetical protein